MRARYSAWDGSQDPFGPELPAADVLEAISDDVLMGSSVDQALQRLLRNGMQGRFSGLDALRRRLQRQRRAEEEAMNLSGPLDQVREALEDILERERAELSFRDDEDARMREAFLDALPPDAPGKIRELQDYRFVDPTAQQLFDAMMQQLREDVLGSYFRNMAQGMKDLSPEQLARFRDMLADLNSLIEKRSRGEDTAEDFARFMDRHGDLFPDRPRTSTSSWSRWPAGWPR